MRTPLLVAHIAVSVGWLGALLAYLALDVAATAGRDPARVRAAFVAMELVASRAIVPLALATLASGVWISLATRWGLVRHYWVVLSLALTIVAVAVLLVEMGTIRAYAALAADPRVDDAAILSLPGTLVHSIGGLLVLLAVLVLNVVKPRGLTPYGWRRERRARGGR